VLAGGYSTGYEHDPEKVKEYTGHAPDEDAAVQGSA
jgi:hypothetical protein